MGMVLGFSFRGLWFLKVASRGFEGKDKQRASGLYKSFINNIYIYKAYIKLDALCSFSFLGGCKML